MKNVEPPPPLLCLFHKHKQLTLTKCSMAPLAQSSRESPAADRAPVDADVSSANTISMGGKPFVKYVGFSQHGGVGGWRTLRVRGRRVPGAMRREQMPPVVSPSFAPAVPRRVLCAGLHARARRQGVWERGKRPDRGTNCEKRRRE